MDVDKEPVSVFLNQGLLILITMVLRVLHRYRSSVERDGDGWGQKEKSDQCIAGPQDLAYIQNHSVECILNGSASALTFNQHG